MIITELYIKNFGKFTERRFFLRDGVQVIGGENEFGKTTLHAFIRAMLFGMERGRGRAAAKDEFTRYEPWEDPARYAGSMRFLCGGRNFRLDRDFTRSSRTSLICEDDGEELSVEDGDLGMLLGGVRAGLFDSTVSVGQLRAEPGQDLAKALEDYAANYYETGGGEFSISEAMQTLKERKKETAREIREEEAALEEEQKKLVQERRYLERDMERLRAEADDRETALRREEAQAGQYGARTHGEQAGPERPGLKTLSAVLISCGAAILLLGISGLIWTGWNAWQGHPGNLLLSGAAGLFVVAGLGMALTGIRRRRREQMKGTEEETRASEDIRHRLEWERILREYKEKEILCGNISEQLQEMGKTDRALSLEKRYRALEIAQDQMQKAAEETGSRMALAVDRRASDIFCAITDGRYTQISTDRRKGITVWDGVRRIPAHCLSRGALEQVWFSMRMASADVLLEEPLPVILDDVFAFYDDKRLETVLKWLSKEKKQVIIFTCHKREEEILNKINMRKKSIR